MSQSSSQLLLVNGTVAVLSENILQFPVRNADGSIFYKHPEVIDALLRQKVKDTLSSLEAGQTIYDE